MLLQPVLGDLHQDGPIRWAEKISIRLHPAIGIDAADSVKRFSKGRGIPLYLDYLRRAGTWFADLPLVLAALPFTLTMRALNGGSYDFSGDMTARVIAAALFCSALAYVAGLAVETIVRAAIGAVRRL
jgi:hypothetical protein